MDNGYMILGDGSRIELRMGNCYGNLDYTEYFGLHHNIVELSPDLFESVYDGDLGTEFASSSITIETDVTETGEDVIIDRLVLPEGVEGLHIWPRVTIREPFTLPASIKRIDVGTGHSISNLIEFTNDKSKDIVLRDIDV